MEDFKMLVCDI